MKIPDNQIINFFIRLPIAASFLGHGLVRIPKLSGFQNWMVGTMQASVIPTELVSVWAMILPFIEIILGIWLLLGFQLKWAIIAGLTLCSILILGSSSIENWGAIEAQLLHAAYLLGVYALSANILNQEK